MPAPINLPIEAQTKLFDQTENKLGVNVADKLAPETETKIWMYMLEQFIQPQINARRPYEKLWDLLYDAYRMRLKLSDMKFRDDEKQFVENILERIKKSGNKDMILTDSLVFDTVDRLSNITHYISWKDGKPVQFGEPEDYSDPLQDLMYSPTEDKHRSQNAVLSWSFKKEDAYGKSRLANRDYFLYGFAYGFSDLYYQIGQTPTGIVLQDIGVCYKPKSVRTVFVDWRIPITEMNDQPCPFWFDQVPVFKIMSNRYDPSFNPFGYVNLDKAYKMTEGSDSNTYFFGGESWNQAITARLQSMGMGTLGEEQSKYCKIKAKWTFLPMLPFDPTNGDFQTRADGSPVPFRRFIVETWGSDLLSNKIAMIRLQDVTDHYEGELPLYGAQHLADLSSSAYSMSICEALINAAIELTQTIGYALENKNLINSPPSQHVIGSPSLNVDVNKPNAKIEVLGPNDFAWRQVPDATQSTMVIANGIRDRAQATGRVTESILGKALGGRTTALEAGNLFETSMSQITTDINIYNDAFNGGHAKRLFTAYCKWLDPDLVKRISGMYGWPVDSIDRALKIAFRCDVGNRYITSQVKQQKIQFMLQAAVQSPVLDQAILWQEYAKESGMPQLQKAIIDNGRDRQIGIAKEQCFKTYLNEPIIISPSQNHQIAMEVKTRFIEDTNSEWNERYGKLPYLATNIPRTFALAQQVQLHQNYLMQQQQMAAHLALTQAASQITDQSQQARLQQQAQAQPQQS